MTFAKLALVTVLMLATAVTQALDIKPYSAAAFSQAQLEGKPVALHFFADWCPVCRAQQKAIFDLRAQGKISTTLFVANYDDEKALRKKYNVRTQSTLIVFSGKRETGRIAGETAVAKIEAALRTKP